MTTLEQNDLNHEATRLGGRYSGLVDALVALANYREALPHGQEREALRAFHAVLGEKADEAKVLLDAAIERLDASYRTKS